MVGTWFGEFCSCCCLPLLPQLACSILPTTYQPLFPPPYVTWDPISLRCCKAEDTSSAAAGTTATGQATVTAATDMATITAAVVVAAATAAGCAGC